MMNGMLKFLRCKMEELVGRAVERLKEKRKRR